MNSIFEILAGVQPMSEKAGSVYSMRIINDIPHTCNDDCEKLHLIHNFIGGWMMKSNCPHNTYEREATIEEIRKGYEKK